VACTYVITKVLVFEDNCDINMYHDVHKLFFSSKKFIFWMCFVLFRFI
jgi:hypothetical protein